MTPSPFSTGGVIKDPCHMDKRQSVKVRDFKDPCKVYGDGINPRLRRTLKIASSCSLAWFKSEDKSTDLVTYSAHSPLMD